MTSTKKTFVHGSPKATIISDERGKGKGGGSVADETITDGAQTTATMERGMRQRRQLLRTTAIHTIMTRQRA